MERKWILLVLLLAATAAIAKPAKDRVIGPVATNGSEAVQALSAPVRPNPLDDEGGTPNSTYEVIGTTWYDYQTNGTHGKQIAVDAQGYTHLVWTNGEQEGSAERHIYYDCWSPETGGMMFPGGVRVDGSSRAGFCNVVAGANGFGFPAYHEVFGTLPHSTASIDFTARAGAFTSIVVPFPSQEPQVIWPRADMDRHGKIHMVATESGGASEEYYARGVPVYEDEIYGTNIDWEQPFADPWEPASFVTIDVACSRISDRVAVAWIADPTDVPPFLDDENIMLKISDDGGETWGPTVPVTNLAPVDTSCFANGGTYETCVGDTFRPWVDLSIIFDDDDNVHIAFTAQAYYGIDETGAPGPFGYVYATIWHWGEDREEFNLVNQAFFANDSVALGVNNLMCHRPSLAIDTTNGYLYCSFQQFDQHAYSDAGYPCGEFYMSVSTDNGQTWAVPTNVSNTPGEPGMPTGNDPSERDITTAKYVTDGTIHTLYLHDYACGSAVASSGPEGPATQNDMIYMRIPVGDIPTTPLQEIWAFRSDSTGFPFELAADPQHEELPSQFTLYQNYPNPFNPSTTIQFDLAKAGNVKLAVFDVTGRAVATLVDGAMSAGAHTVEFDGANLTSGVYFARLEMGGASQARKMALIK